MIRAKRIRTHRPITLTLRLTTIARLEAEVERGSWSAVIDQAIILFLNSIKP